MKKLVIIESPLGRRVDGTICTPQELAENVVYARACMADSLRRGDEAPYGSHLLYPQVLDDATPAERRLGMEAGFDWGAAAAMAKAYSDTHAGGDVPRLDAFAAIYVDRGITSGMAEGIERHKRNGLQVVERRLGGGWAK
jgi:hypothetical protein